MNETTEPVESPEVTPQRPIPDLTPSSEPNQPPPTEPDAPEDAPGEPGELDVDKDIDDSGKYDGGEIPTA